jgi:2-hydroxychromene-2-carboxylate isomerase
MGDVLHFPSARTRRDRLEVHEPSSFFFDVCSPFSYLAAERVERQLPDVEWVAVDGSALHQPRGAELTQLRLRAEARAQALRLPLEWPDQFPLQAPRALRAAAFACELGAGPAFALAASRLAFCGGYGLDDPEILAEAAAAAAVPLRACLDAARESWRDEELREVAEILSDAGIRELPAFRVGGRWLSGEAGFSAAASVVAPHKHAARSSAPVA